METLKNKIDFVVLVTADKANVNGDPLDGNRPRTDYDGYGEISDVCIKRKIRNRMQDLKKNANIRIIPYFDESGIISYVEFWLPDNVTTALSDEELHVINQAYTGVKMDLSFAVGRNGYGMKIEEFHCSGFFEIPFEDLKY